MTKHPRQSDLDRLVKAAVKAEIPRAWQIALREVDGKVEPVLMVDGKVRTVATGPDEVELG